MPFGVVLLYGRCSIEENRENAAPVPEPVGSWLCEWQAGVSMLPPDLPLPHPDVPQAPHRVQG